MPAGHAKRTDGGGAVGDSLVRLGHGVGRLGRLGDGVGQRVRLGLTGLAAIFLMVLIAAASLTPAQSLRPLGGQGEPLAVLGVAPGAGPTGFSRSGPTPPPPRPSRT